MRISKELSRIKRLGVDTSPYIYYVEGHPAYVNKVDEVLKIAQTQPIALYTSAITLTETLIKPIKIGDYVLANAYRNLLMRTAYVTLVAITPRLAESAAHLRAQYGLRTPDALHAASAISSNCDAFLTNDLAFKKVKEISILILDELDLSLA